MVMQTVEGTQLVGRVLRASTTGFDCGTRSAEISHQSFGAFVRVAVGNGNRVDVIGLIHAIRIDDDPLVRQLIMANSVSSSTLMDQRANRMVPVEISVLNVGYFDNGVPVYSLPPRPPLSLSEVALCTEEEVYHFTQSCNFFRLVLNTTEVPAEELLAASLRYASLAYPVGRARYDFLVKCGRQLAGMLAHDLPRLDHLLKLIRPR